MTLRVGEVVLNHIEGSGVCPLPYGRGSVVVLDALACGQVPSRAKQVR
jgi:hypothetical protein